MLLSCAKLLLLIGCVCREELSLLISISIAKLLSNCLLLIRMLFDVVKTVCCLYFFYFLVTAVTAGTFLIFKFI